MILTLGEQLGSVDVQDISEIDSDVVIVTTSDDSKGVFRNINVDDFGEYKKQGITFNKVEAYRRCVVGTLCVPRMLTEVNKCYSIYFYVDNHHIVIVDDDKFAEELIHRMMEKKSHQGENKAQFIFNFFSEFMSKDVQVLEQYERMLMEIEENIIKENSVDSQSELVPIRKKLLILREYYGEIAEVGKELETNEVELFEKEELRYFGIISDRAERLMTKAAHILEYATQVRDASQIRAVARQNENMQFLTVISTIFFPLTLITGWYGMNFSNMPELEQGYPGVIVMSLFVVIICIVIFKKKKIF